ncbi:MAG TPA: toprim domain-containing protein [Terriglobales bacterium]
MSTDWVDFREIKERVAIIDVVARYGVKLRRVGPDGLRGKCPLPMHSSRNSVDSFSISLSRNAWSCQSASCVAACSGRVGGNVLDLVALLERCSLREAALHLQDWFGSASPNVGQRSHRAEPGETANSANRPLSFTLHHIDRRHVYLRGRDIHPETADTFGVGMYDGSGFLHGRIVIPIHNEHGQLVAYAGRAVDHQQPKYRLPAGFRKSDALFNLHRAARTGDRSVIVVEGFFDALKVHQAGYPSVVALMGSSLSKRQAHLLTSHFDHVVLMLDADEAGQRGTETILDQLKPKMPITPLRLSKGVQPDQLASGEISSILRSHRHEIDTRSR